MKPDPAGAAFCPEQESEPTQKCSLAPTWLRTKKIPVSLNPLLMPFKLNRKETVNFSEHQNSKKNRKNPKLQKKKKIKPVYTACFLTWIWWVGCCFWRAWRPQSWASPWAGCESAWRGSPWTDTVPSPHSRPPAASWWSQQRPRAYANPNPKFLPNLNSDPGLPVCYKFWELKKNTVYGSSKGK